MQRINSSVVAPMLICPRKLDNLDAITLEMLQSVDDDGVDEIVKMIKPDNGKRIVMFSRNGAMIYRACQGTVPDCPTAGDVDVFVSNM